MTPWSYADAEVRAERTQLSQIPPGEPKEVTALWMQAAHHAHMATLRDEQAHAEPYECNAKRYVESREGHARRMRAVLAELRRAGVLRGCRVTDPEFLPRRSRLWEGLE